VDVLKVQHHGSEHNLDEAFCRAVTADHYVFCGNGAHGNPDVRVVDAIIDSRLGPASALSRNSQVANGFQLWFNSSEGETSGVKPKNHMRDLQAHIEGRAAASGGKLQATFLESDSFFELEV